MLQFLLDLAVHRDRRIARLFGPVKSGVSRVFDGSVSYRLNGRVLALPLSHDLPVTRRLHPGYSDNLRRLAAFLRDRDGAVRMIDVGANVGDSWALAAGGDRDAFLLIEGSARFFRFLERNTAGVPGVTRLHQLLADRDADARGSWRIDRGNAQLVESAGGGEAMRCRALDSLLEAHPAFRGANLLKVDVEGFDTRVLRGARGLLAGARPVVFFEHQPRAVLEAGEDDHAVFAELAALGYRHPILYDNQGHLVGEVDSGGDRVLDTLLGYARQREDFYFDVCCFHEGRADARAAFLGQERAALPGIAGDRAR